LKQLHETGILIKYDTGEREDVFFRPETRVTIPMRNLRVREAQYKGCAFQVESANEMKTFMAPSLAKKNEWARTLNIVLGDLRTSGRYAFVVRDNDENNSVVLTTPLRGKQSLVDAMPNSAEKQLQQRLAVQQLAQSLQSKRTATRVAMEVTPQRSEPTVTTPVTAPARVLTFGGVNVDRWAEIDALNRGIAERENALQDKETELSDALQRLQREQQYREQITVSVFL
jgi:hypothetical protein